MFPGLKWIVLKQKGGGTSALVGKKEAARKQSGMANLFT